MKTYTAEVYSTEKYQLGESPFYDSRTKTLFVLAGTVSSNYVFYAKIK